MTAPILSKVELETLHLLAEGLTQREIATRRFVSVATVKTQCGSINAKLGATTAAGAVHLGHLLGLLDGTGSLPPERKAVLAGAWLADPAVVRAAIATVGGAS